MLVLRRIVFGRRADRQAFAFRDDREVLFDRPQQVFIDVGRIAERAQIVGDVEYRGQRRAVGERRNAGVDDADAVLDRLERAQRAEAGAAMGVEFDLDAGAVLQDDGDEGAHAIGRQEPARVLEAKPVRCERNRLAGALGIIFVGVARRNRVDEVEDRRQPGLAGTRDTPRPARQVVPRRRNPRLLHTVRRNQVDAELVNFRRVEAEGVERPGVQPQRRALHAGGNPPDEIPGILAQFAHRLLELRARQEFALQRARRCRKAAVPKHEGDAAEGAAFGGSG